MRSEAIISLLSKMGASKIKSGQKTIKATCVLAPWTHENGVDKTPSLSVFIADGGISGFRCFSCGRKGSLHALVNEFEGFTHTMHEDLHEFVSAEEDLLRGLSRQARKAQEQYEWVQPESIPWETYPDSILQRYDTRPHPYFLDRGFTEDEWNRWGLRYDDRMKRIVFPVRNRDSEIVGIIGRTVNGAEAKYYTYGRWRSGMPFGIHLLGRDAVVVAEGPLDSIRISSSGAADGIAVCGTHAAIPCLPMLKTLWDRKMILLLDADKAGQEAQGLLVRQLRQSGNLWKGKVPEGRKDPGELSPAECREVVESAEWVAP